MNRIFPLLFLLLIVANSAISQNYYTECVFSSPGHFIKDIKVSSAGEITLFGFKAFTFEKVIIRLDKTGKKLWETNFVQDDLTFFDVDNAGNVNVVTGNHSGDFKIFKFLANNGSSGPPKTFTEPSDRVNNVVIDKAGNVYILLQFDGVSNSSTLVAKYNANGVWQWTSPVNTLAYGDGNIVLNADGNIFVVTNAWYSYYYPPLPTTFYSYLELYKFDAAGNLSDYSPLETNIYTDTDEGRFFETRSIYVDHSENLVVVNEKEPMYSYMDMHSDIYIVDRHSLDILWEHTIPFGRLNQFGDKLRVDVTTPDIYIAGKTSLNAQSINLAKISENHTYSLLTDALDFNYPPTTFSMLIDPLGPITTVGVNPGSNSTRMYINDYSNNGTLKGQFQYFGPRFDFQDAPGQTVFDFESNLLSPMEDCILKVTPCAKVPFTITSQPATVEVCSGVDAKFQVNVSGKGLSFYWYKNNSLISTSTKFEGTNTGTLTVRQASVNDAGSYSCEIKDACGRILKTQSAVLSVPSTPTLTAQPANLSRCIGAEAVFQITATGGKNLKYQWKKGATALAESTTLVGTKTNKLTLKAASVADAGEYYCEVTADCSPAVLVSQKATLGVQAPTAITKHPGDLASCTGSTVVLSINATGTNLTYQWKKAGTDLVESSRYVGTKSNTLTLSQLQASDGGDYTCVVTGACGGSQTSSKGVLTVATDQQITNHPESKNICLGANVTFSVTASANGATYQWVKGNTNLTNNTRISGVTTSSLTIKTATANDEGAYSCIITTSCGNKRTSKVAQLSIGTTTSITSKSTDLNLCAGELAKFSITTNVSDIDFQWKKDGISLSDGPSISGTQSSELFVNDINPSNAGNYTCEVTSICGPVQASGIIKLEVRKKIEITEQPTAQTLCEEDDFVLKISTTGTSPVYQWKNKDGILANDSRISGATSPILTIKNLSFFEEGYYTCEVKGCDGITASNTVFVRVNRKPKLILQNQIDCSNPIVDWSSLVDDQNNTFGDYLLFKGNLTERIPDLWSIRETGEYFIMKQTETCSDTIQWNNLCLITATEFDNTYDVSIYPNPTDRWIYIRYNPAKLIEFDLLDSQGRKISGGILNSTGEALVDGNILSGGVYSVLLKDDKGKTILQRLIVKR